MSYAQNVILCMVTIHKFRRPNDDDDDDDDDDDNKFNNVDDGSARVHPVRLMNTE